MGKRSTRTVGPGCGVSPDTDLDWICGSQGNQSQKRGGSKGRNRKHRKEGSPNEGVMLSNAADFSAFYLP